LATPDASTVDEFARTRSWGEGRARQSTLVATPARESGAARTERARARARARGGARRRGTHLGLAAVLHVAVAAAKARVLARAELGAVDGRGAREERREAQRARGRHPCWRGSACSREVPLSTGLAA